MGTLSTTASSSRQEGTALGVEGISVDARSVGISFDDLYRLHVGEATQVARAITRNADDAADAVADAFAGVFSAVSSGRLDGTEILRPYLLAATRNAAIDIVRRAGRLTPTDQPDVLDHMVLGSGPSDRLLAGEDRDMVGRAFGDLPPRWRAVLWLTEVEGMAPRDAAPLLGLTPNATAQLAVRARTRLRERFVQFHVRNHARGDCLETAERLGGLVAGELTAAQANRVRGHLAECAECRSRLADLEDVGLALRRATWAPAAATGLAGLARRLRWPWHRSRRRRLGPAARVWRAAADPPVVDFAGAVAQVSGSPVLQQVAGAVTAGLLVLGVGAAVVRQQQAPDPPAEAAARTVASPTIAPFGPPAAPITTVPPETTTSAPAGPAPGTGVQAAFVPRGPLAAAERSTVAYALGPQLAVYDAPGAATARLVLANPRPSGAPLVLLVVDQRPGWLDVLLPVRPNGSSGWIRADEVRLAVHDFKIVVELGAHRITAYQGTDVLVSEPIGVGTAEAPTPGGLYFITELFRPADGPSGPYGPYAYGLSGHSDVLYDFGGGDGQFGIHGTNDPGGLGHDVSHGCIRMSNAGISRLAAVLPLGVPVDIQA
jgi:RNA polymerase sigma factor (sigma-70 family)